MEKNCVNSDGILSQIGRHLERFRAPVYLLLSGVIGFFLYSELRDDVFRGASLSIELSRPGAIRKAKQFLTSRGYSLEGAQESVAFFNYETPGVYLEKAAGTEKANAWLKEDRLPVWGWQVRFFWPLQQEEFAVWWSPKGNLNGFEHQIPREKSLPTLSKDEALALALNFLQKNDTEKIGSIELVEESEDDKTGRIDHVFRWKVKDAPLSLRYYVSAVVSGNELSSIRKEVEVPESFSLAEDHISSKRSLLSAVFSKLDSLLSCLMVFFFIFFWWRHVLRWKPAAIFAGVLFVFQLLAYLNQLPLFWHDYNTTETIPAFWISTLAVPILVRILASGWVVIQLSAADSAGARMPGAPYSLGEVLRSSFFKSREFFVSTVVGFGAAGLQLGFVVLFYVMGHRYLGFYSPMETRYNDLLTTAIPWISPLLVGLKPALMEEAVYRLFSISILYRLTKKKWLSIIVSAALWGFLHTGYYVEPIYARGIELTLVGIGLGALYLRFGIWTTIVCHFVYNATLSSSLLFASGDRYLQVSSVCVILLLGVPLIFSLIRLARGENIPTLGFSSFPWPAPQEKKTHSIDRRVRAEYAPLSLRWPFWISLGSLALTFLLVPIIHAPSTSLSRSHAVSLARSVLEKLKFPTDGQLVSTSLYEKTPDETAVRYLRTKLKSQQLSQYMEENDPTGAMWWVQFTSKTDSNSCQITLNERNVIDSLYCKVPEETPGAKPTQRESKRKAEEFLRSLTVDPHRLKFVGTTETDRPSRKDSKHRWSDPAANVDELQQIVTVSLSGDRVSGFGTYFEPPESFIRSEVSQNAWNVIRKICLFVLAGALVFVLFRSLLDRVVLSPVPSKLPFTLAFVSIFFALGDWLVEVYRFWDGFDSSTPTEVYIGRQLLNFAGQAVGAGLTTFIILVLFLRLPPQIFPEAPTFQDLKIILKRPPWRWRNTRASLAWAITLICLDLFLRTALGRISGNPSSQTIDPNYSAFSTLLPTYAFASATWKYLLFWLAFGVGFAALRKYSTLKWSLVMIGVLIVYLTGQWGGDSALESTQSLTSILVTAFIIFQIVQFRLPFYLWYSVLQAAIGFLPWLISPQFGFRIQAQLVWAIVLIMGILTAIPGRRFPTPAPDVTVPG
jgi:hypothetical protein